MMTNICIQTNTNLLDGKWNANEWEGMFIETIQGVDWELSDWITTRFVGPIE